MPPLLALVVVDKFILSKYCCTGKLNSNALFQWCDRPAVSRNAASIPGAEVAWLAAGYSGTAVLVLYCASTVVQGHCSTVLL